MNYLKLTDVDTSRVPCPKCSPKTAVVVRFDTHFTSQGSVRSLTCVMCGYSKDVTTTYTSHDGVKQDVSL